MNKKQKQLIINFQESNLFQDLSEKQAELIKGAVPPPRVCREIEQCRKQFLEPESNSLTL